MMRIVWYDMYDMHDMDDMLWMIDIVWYSYEWYDALWQDDSLEYESRWSCQQPYDPDSYDECALVLAFDEPQDMAGIQIGE